uniref:Uncharacterized protein n=1 Tax=Siphoviridae sp. ctXZx16 TaxID=2826371 RepID=A0A8S5ML33_9CAUD|nr:MAG TPA: hypothetical protein [Siphoviridae sp. ctXZx16]DAO32103.1 MAG TPA: hypothetical protein [Caudoviricetes sp.]
MLNPVISTYNAVNHTKFNTFITYHYTKTYVFLSYFKEIFLIFLKKNKLISINNYRFFLRF